MPLDFESEREVERLLALANLQRMRGQWTEAEETLAKALAIAPGDVTLREMLGDVLAECGKLDQALAEYHAGLQSSPGKASLEKKHAKMVLAIGEKEHEKALAKDMLENPAKYNLRRRKPGTALLIALVPGLGQIYNGEYVKGGVISGMVLLFFIAMAAMQTPYPSTTYSITDLLHFTNPLVLLVGFLAFIAYIYGLIDAPITADKSRKDAK
ncbi:MAG: tetratricopeptide repeat protein [Armatimonadota bacterium]